MINVFIMCVFKYDYDKQYAEFKKLTSVIYIMIVIISLSMNINMSDIEQIIFWKFSLDDDFTDHWQWLDYDE